MAWPSPESSCVFVSRFRSMCSIDFGRLRVNRNRVSNFVRYLWQRRLASRRHSIILQQPYSYPRRQERKKMNLKNNEMRRGAGVFLAQLAVILPLSVGQSVLDQIGFCGDCYCVPSVGETCPGMESMPQVEFSQEYLTTLRSLSLDNPFFLGCNPYESEECDTTPPLETGDACVVEVSVPQTPGATCPTQFSYRLVTVASREDVQDHQILTHEGACGVCSSLQDLSVYMETPDLASLGISCAFRAIVNFDDGVACYIEAGFTQPCALMWAYNSLQTNAECGAICVDHAVSGDPNFGPPPSCEPVECLVCDEQSSGPKFLQVAGRTRRNSGLLSGQVRNCTEIASIVHIDPCQSDLALAGCEEVSALEESISPIPGTQCSCEKTGEEAEMTCVEPNCSRCNSDSSVCAEYTYGEVFTAEGQSSFFFANIDYISGLSNRVTYFEESNSCQISVDDELCTSCVNIACADDDSPGLEVSCENVPGGVSFSTCDPTFSTDGPLQFFNSGEFDDCVDISPPPPTCGGQFAACTFGPECCSGRCVSGRCRLASLNTGKAASKLSQGRGGAAGVPKGRVRGL